MKTLVEVDDLAIRTPGGRALFDGLSLRLARERVALVGRNGVGKSTLLAVLAGVVEAQSGRVKTSSKPHFVAQALTETPERMSHGELRRRALAEAKASGAEILLLDEPSEDLDEEAVSWLRSWLKEWPGCVVLASHDRRLLADFQHFFIASESGCRCFCGTLDELDAEVEKDHQGAQQRYVRNLNRLVEYEEHTAHVARRKARKKRSGRCRELDRATSRPSQPRTPSKIARGAARCPPAVEPIHAARARCEPVTRAAGAHTTRSRARPSRPA